MPQTGDVLHFFHIFLKYSNFRSLPPPDIARFINNYFVCRFIWICRDCAKYWPKEWIHRKCLPVFMTHNNDLLPFCHFLPKFHTDRHRWFGQNFFIFACIRFLRYNAKFSLMRKFIKNMYRSGCPIYRFFSKKIPSSRPEKW